MDKLTEKNEIDVSVLFNEDTTEETKDKIKAVFEAAVQAKAEELTAITEEQIDEIVSERVSEIAESLESAVDSYLSYVAENWLEENEIAIESSMKVEMAESLLEGIAGLMRDHDLEVPDGADDVVEMLVARNEELEGRLNESIRARMDLEESIELAEVEATVDALSEGLTDTQASKLKSLAEGIKFSDAEDFERKLGAIKASFFKEDATVADPTVDPTGPLVEDKKVIEESADPFVAEITKRVNSRL